MAALAGLVQTQQDTDTGTEALDHAGSDQAGSDQARSEQAILRQTADRTANVKQKRTWQDLLQGIMRAPRRRSEAPEAGFSLLEVIVVLMIIGLVATLVGPRLFEQFDRSKVTAAEVQMKSLAAALDQMRLDLNRFPNEAEGLEMLVRRPADQEGWRGPYLDEDIPKDPWGNDYVYQTPSGSQGRPVLSSLGADGKSGGEGNDADIFSRKLRDE